jgi:mannan endo-1,4-beta-mannosidase
VTSAGADHRRAAIVRSASAGAGAEGIPITAASADVSRGRGTRQAPGAPSGHKTIPSRPARLLKARHARATLPRHNLRSRLVPAAAMLIAAVSVALASSGPVARAMPHQHQPPSAHASLPPRLVSYLGVDGTGRPPSYRPIATFAKAAGKPPDLAGYTTHWAAPFAASFARTLVMHRMTPLVHFDPAGVPLAAITDGRYDFYLRQYATSVRNFGHSTVISFGQDMNAAGHSWGYGNVPPRVFIAAWRHIVTLFRAQGADNVTWMWTISADRPGTSPAASWWPGAAYVSWVSIDGHYSRPGDTFTGIFGRTIKQVRVITAKPILVSVTSVAPAAGPFAKIANVFDGLRRYRTLGLIWTAQDPRHVNREATAALRLGVSALNIARS